MRLKSFSEHLFRVCPILNALISTTDLTSAITLFQNYKSIIPVRGAIILNKKMTKVLMVKGWKSNATWGFPRGKINKDEPDDVCAIREVYEEIGFDISPYLVANEFIDITIRQKNFKLYIIRGVPGNTKFCPQTRKEISKIEWHETRALPAFASDSNTQNINQYFLVAPFMQELAKYIAQKRGLPSSISHSEAAALKNLLGVSSAKSQATINGEAIVDKDAAAAELLNILKSSAHKEEAAASTSDKNVLLSLLKNSTTNTPSVETPHAEMDHAKELLSLLKTEMDRLKEEDALEKATQNQVPYPDISTTAGPPFISPQALPPQPASFGPYFMPPNVPMPMMPFNGAVPIPYPPPIFGMPVPGLPPQLMGPQPGVPLAPSAYGQPQQPPPQLMNPTQVGRPEGPPQPPAQPNAALLALLAKSKTKKLAPKSPSSTTPSTRQATVPPPPGSSSKALLSLLQKPRIAAPTPPVPVGAPIETPKPLSSLETDKNKSGSALLLGLLKTSKPNDTESSTSSTSDSKTLLSMLKGNSVESPKESVFTLSSIENALVQTVATPEPAAAPKNDATALLSLIRENDNTPAPEAPKSDAITLLGLIRQNDNTTAPASATGNSISIKDAVFGSFTQPPVPADPAIASSEPPHVSGFLTVSDLESSQSASYPTQMAAYGSDGNSNIPENIDTGKDLLSFIKGEFTSSPSIEAPFAPAAVKPTSVSQSETPQPVTGSAGNELLSLLRKGPVADSKTSALAPEAVVRMPSPTEIISNTADPTAAQPAPAPAAAAPAAANDNKSRSKALLDFLREYGSGSLNSR